jgi:two-component system, NtrC family, sensor kinase
MTGKVLIVDDSLTVRMDLLELLEAAGMQAQASATIASAMEALAQDEFALVILDVLLPDGDGIELLKEIRAMPSAANTAVMVLSGETEIRDRIRGLTTGADEYVGKPYEPVYLVARVRELIRDANGCTTSVQQTILLIDDSVTFREALKDVLERVGYRVLVRKDCSWSPIGDQLQSLSMGRCPASTARPSFGAYGSTQHCAACLVCC